MHACASLYSCFPLHYPSKSTLFCLNVFTLPHRPPFTYVSFSCFDLPLQCNTLTFSHLSFHLCPLCCPRVPCHLCPDLAPHACPLPFIYLSFSSLCLSFHSPRLSIICCLISSPRVLTYLTHPLTSSSPNLSFVRSPPFLFPLLPFCLFYSWHLSL